MVKPERCAMGNVTNGGLGTQKGKSAAAGANWIASIIDRYLGAPKKNAIAPGASEPAFGQPLIGFGSGSDPVFQQLKDSIGPFYWTPEEIFGLTFPNLKCNAGSLSVISWILPQTEATKNDSRRCNKYPSRRWSLWLKAR